MVFIASLGSLFFVPSSPSSTPTAIDESEAWLGDQKLPEKARIAVDGTEEERPPATFGKAGTDD